MIRTGVIGYGFSAQTFHLPLIECGGSLQLSAISTSKDALTVKEKYPDVVVYSSGRQMIREADIDLVVITAPNDAHFGLAREALQCGKHVILEKPMVCLPSDGEELVGLARSRRLTLSVFHNRRWDGDFLTVKKIINDGLLGDVRFFETHFDRFRPTVRDRWRERPGPGAGIWFDLGSHLLDQALQLFGMPETLTARCLATRDKSEAIDYFHVILHYSGREVILHSSSFSAGPNLRFHVQGTGGSFIKYGLDPQEDQLKSGMLPSHPLFGQENDKHSGVLYTESKREVIPTEFGRYLTYYLEIADAINNGTAPSVSAEDGVKVIRLLELAEISSREGKTVKIRLSSSTEAG